MQLGFIKRQLHSSSQQHILHRGELLSHLYTAGWIKCTQPCCDLQDWHALCWVLLTAWIFLLFGSLFLDKEPLSRKARTQKDS